MSVPAGFSAAVLAQLWSLCFEAHMHTFTQTQNTGTLSFKFFMCGIWIMCAGWFYVMSTPIRVSDLADRYIKTDAHNHAV